MKQHSAAKHRSGKISEINVPPAPKPFAPSLPEPGRLAQQPAFDKYMYLWSVALISFTIGVLAGYGVGFKRFAPELVEQYLVNNQNGLTVEQIRAQGAKRANKEQPTDAAANNLAKADAWLSAQNLNEYGDPKDTVYAGGTPLFNEATGATTPRYQYLKEKFPNEPWLE